MSDKVSAPDPVGRLRTLLETLKPWLKHPPDCGATKPPYTYCSCGLNFAFHSVLNEIAELAAVLREAPEARPPARECTDCGCNLAKCLGYRLNGKVCCPDCKHAAAAAPPAPGWQPIETVPQDRQWVLVWQEDVGFAVYRFGPGLISADDDVQWTHWKHVDPPAAADGSIPPGRPPEP